MTNYQDLIYFKIVGAGSPIVFLHGFLEDHSVWNDIYPEFVNEGYQCILIDLPCHGESRFNDPECTMQYMAQCVFDFLRENEVVNPFVFGHSMGGYVGLELLRLMSLKLTLVHSNFWADASSKKEDRNRVIEVVKKNKDLFLNESIPNLFALQNREFRREQIQNLIQKALKIPASEIGATTAGLRDRNASYDLMNLHTITLIQGSDDSIIPNAILEHEINKLNSRPEVATISNCGHMGFIEQPVALINIIRAVLIR